MRRRQPIGDHLRQGHSDRLAAVRREVEPDLFQLHRPARNGLQSPTGRC